MDRTPADSRDEIRATACDDDDDDDDDDDQEEEEEGNEEETWSGSVNVGGDEGEVALRRDSSGGPAAVGSVIAPTGDV